jgi:hypothetical protein
VIVTGAITVETRVAGGSGGSCASAGFGPVPNAPARGEIRSMTHKLPKNEIARTAIPASTLMRRIPVQAPLLNRPQRG